MTPHHHHQAAGASYPAGLRWARYHGACVQCGQTDKRHLGHGLCSRCYYGKPEVKAYFKAWRESDRGREVQRRAYKKYHQTEKGIAARIRQEATRPDRSAAQKEYNARPEVRERRREWDARPENVERRRGYLHTDKGRAILRRKNHRRRIQKADGDLTIAQELELRQRKTCSLCKHRLSDNPLAKRAKHLDHIVPLNQGGQHTLGNVRVICGACNRKRPRDGSDWRGQLELGMV